MPKRKNNPNKSKDTSMNIQLSTKFVNESKPVKRDNEHSYGFDRVPKLLKIWSRLFQAVVSQAGTYRLTKKFHTGEMGIYKTEGGCKIAGVNDLVLGERSAYWDYGSGDKDKLELMVDLITRIVLGWDPNNPIDSLMSLGASIVGVTPEQLKEAIEKASCGGVFGGDPLRNFFDSFGFAPEKPDAELEEYTYYCRTVIKGETPEAVKQDFADKALGRELLVKLQEKARSNKNNGFSIPMCCSPRRNKNELIFWINTGRSTNIDGWKTQLEIEAFLTGDGAIIETRR